jgi:hypothetical protein
MSTGGFIYAIGLPGCHLVTIGTTTGPVTTRLASLQSGQCERLTPLAQVRVEQDLSRVEAAIHQFLEADRQHAVQFAVHVDQAQFEALVERALHVDQKKLEALVKRAVQGLQAAREGPEACEIPAPPYTAADLQTMADALRPPAGAFATIAVCVPWSTWPRGEPLPRSPLTITLSPLTDALQAAAQRYLLERAAAQRRVSRGAQQEALTHIHDLVTRISHDVPALSQALAALDLVSYERLWRQGHPPLAGLEALEHVRTVTRECGMKLERPLRTLLALLKPALADLADQEDDPSRRPREVALQTFLGRLCEVYACATGRPPGRSRNYAGEPSGPFLRFVRACLLPVAPEWCEPKRLFALEHHIRTVLDARRPLT